LKIEKFLIGNWNERRQYNTIQILCKAFALRIIKLYTFLKEEKQEYVLSKQVLRSGTSIGANARESINAQSTMDFIHKLGIALKEANETQYWLELLYESEFINEKEYNSIYADCSRIVATLVKIIKTKKETLN
jgi:four helix bundle protein